MHKINIIFMVIYIYNNHDRKYLKNFFRQKIHTKWTRYVVHVKKKFTTYSLKRKIFKIMSLKLS